uniref:Alpha-ketoglutarate-dependent dioxygenase alkB homolog 3 n=1 Tax=Paramormyrops kingsleyae TaxID=1676925 RepID=A0A3B3QGP5_9TELE
MGDKRQRARVQGSWAKSAQLPKGGARGRGEDSVPCQPRAACWGTGPQAFEFHQPAKPLREVPVEKVIEHAGEYQISQGPTGVSRLRLVPGFLSQEEADWMFSKLLAELPWSQKTNFKQGSGRAYEEPRLTCWFGELPYTYSNSTLQPSSQWHPVLIQLREAVEQASGRSFNSLLCNLYRDGKDSIAWHSDSEASLGPEPVIASLSLGDTRCFSLRKQPGPEEDGDYTYVERVRIPLAHGTLLLMEGATQEDWQTDLPERRRF